jgi:sugar phosphate permease
MSFAMSGGLVLAYLVAAFITRWQDNFLVSSISLTALAILLIVVCKRLDPLLKKDKVEEINVENVPHRTKTGTGRILISSGFLMMLIAMFFCSMVESSVKNYSATMIFQSYENISPTIANLLGVLIIIAGILGILLIKFLLFPRIIKSEFLCYLLSIALSLPALIVLQYLGKTPLSMVLISLCLINMFITAGNIMSNYFIVRFSKYGMNGTAVGLVNSAAAFGFALQYCMFGVIADGNGGWQRVVFIWLGLVVAAVIAIIFGIKPSIKFSKSEE